MSTNHKSRLWSPSDRERAQRRRQEAAQKAKQVREWRASLISPIRFNTNFDIFQYISIYFDTNFDISTFGWFLISFRLLSGVLDQNDDIVEYIWVNLGILAEYLRPKNKCCFQAKMIQYRNWSIPFLVAACVEEPQLKK